MQNQNSEIQELKNRLVDYLNRYDPADGIELAERLEEAIARNETDLLNGLGYEIIDPLKAIYYERVLISNKPIIAGDEINEAFLEELERLRFYLWS